MNDASPEIISDRENVLQAFLAIHLT